MILMKLMDILNNVDYAIHKLWNEDLEISKKKYFFVIHWQEKISAHLLILAIKW